MREGRLTLGAAKAIAGSLGYPTKMPCTSYGLPATACIAGAKLAKVPGSACSKCYALFGRTFYRRPNARKGMARRLSGVTHPAWVVAMVRLLTHVHAQKFIRVDLGTAGVRAQRAGGQRFRLNETGFHRWHDSGDLQSIEHLARICEVARRTPRIRHWLPTQELGFVKSFIAQGGAIPSNLIIRVSTVMLDDPRPRAWSHGSMVFEHVPPRDVHLCPAQSQGNFCGSCRACWNPNVKMVAYAAH